MDKDGIFIEGYKADWNRFCNTYVPRNRNTTSEDYEIERIQENSLHLQVKLGHEFGRLYETYLKYKFIPDNRFFITLDEEFTTTIKLIHSILGMNPYPQTKDNDPDEAYNIRWRAIILFDYLQILANNPLRYIGLLTFRLVIFFAVPVIILLNIITGIQTLLR